jgi:GT2 family glycosyltransferase
VKIVVVVVLYNCKLTESHTVKSLLAMPLDKYAEDCDINVIIYDNGLAGTQDNPPNHTRFQYVSVPDNQGLPGAYNYALKESFERDVEWLLLLDQDTKLPLQYFKKLHDAVMPHNESQHLVAVVPKMCCEGVFFSPSKVLYAGVMRPVEQEFLGIYPKEIFAIGSCSLLRVAFLREIGGFSKDYWLDSLDRWLYKKVHSLKRSVLVTDIIVEHELSVMNFDKFMSETRYRNILNFESKFMMNHCSFFENTIFILRLFVRSIKLYIVSKNKKFAFITAKHIFHFLNRNKD